VTPTTHPLDRRSGVDRRRSLGAASRDAAGPASPIADWPLVVPDQLRDVRTGDAWARVVHQAILDACCGDGSDADAAWEDGAAWHLDGYDPTGPDEAVGTESIRAFHRDLQDLTDGTYRQELVSLESGRGPLVEAHLRTTARSGERELDIPSLLIFELPSLRIRRVTELPGDLRAWDAFWMP
jgi:hypothetical protein